MITTTSLEISTIIFIYNLVLWSIWSVRCIAIIQWQWFLLFKLTFRGGHYQHPSCYSLFRFLKSWNVITSWSKQNLPLVFPVLSLQVNERQTLGKLYKQPQVFKICIVTTCFHSSQSFRNFSFNFILSLAQGMLINRNFPVLLLLWPKRKDKKKSSFHLVKVSPSTFHKARVIRGRIKATWMA